MDENKEYRGMIKVFVYGSLKEGFCNHSAMCSAVFLGDATTVKEFGMFKDVFGNYPYLVDKPYAQVQGELYEVTDELLKSLDHFEGVPDYYHRKPIDVKNKNNIVISAFCYFQEEETHRDKKYLKMWRE